ncbi:MAG: hypothetical protein JSR61_02660 [Proteobacteria bacterium]|nr:hypothetical protein [Pseudomonadota bacterium]
MNETRRTDSIERESDLAAILGGADAARIGDLFGRLASAAPTPAMRQAWQRAARAFFQSAARGRQPIDDASAVREVLDLVESGAVRSRHQALMRVARRLAGHGSPNAIYERLRKKTAPDEKTTHVNIFVGGPAGRKAE